MNILNQLATDLFKKLINNGDKYLENCNNYNMFFKVNNTYYQILLSNKEVKEATPIKLNNSNVSFSFWNTQKSSNENNYNLKFIICKDHSQYYDVFLSRVEMAQYLDKVEDIMKRWEENQLIKSLEIINKETDEFNEEF